MVQAAEQRGLYAVGANEVINMGRQQHSTETDQLLTMWLKGSLNQQLLGKRLVLLSQDTVHLAAWYHE